MRALCLLSKRPAVTPSARPASTGKVRTINFRDVNILVLICIVLFSVVLLPGGTANSAVIEGGRDYYLGPEGAIDDDLYIAGGNIEVMGAVLGDLTAAGGNLYAKGKISQDVQLAGGHLTIEGQIGDDLRAAGGMLYVNGIVNGDAFLAGGHVTVGPEAVLKKGVWIAGNEVRILGSMDGEVRIAANTVTVNGIIRRTCSGAWFCSLSFRSFPSWPS